MITQNKIFVNFLKFSSYFIGMLGLMYIIDIIFLSNSYNQLCQQGYQDFIVIPYKKVFENIIVAFLTPVFFIFFSYIYKRKKDKKISM